jgi:hypothetical protein
MEDMKTLENNDITELNTIGGHEDLEDPNLIGGHEDLEDPNLIRGHEDLEDPNLIGGHEDLEDPNLIGGHEETYSLSSAEIDIEELDKYNEEIDKELKEMLELGEVSIEEHEKFEQELREKAEALPDDLFKEIADAKLNELLENNKNISPDERIRYRHEIINKLKFYETLSTEFEKENKDFNEKMKANREELNDLFKVMNYKEALDKIKDLKKLAKEENKTVMFTYYDKMENEIESIFYLKNMKKKIINKHLGSKHTTEVVNSRYDNEFKKFSINLRKNRKYKFLNPEPLLEKLSSFLPEEDAYIAKTFLYSLCRYVNSGDGQKNVENNAIFLEGIIKNIYFLDKDDEEIFNKENKDIFIENIYDYVHMIRED